MDDILRASYGDKHQRQINGRVPTSVERAYEIKEEFDRRRHVPLQVWPSQLGLRKMSKISIIHEDISCYW